MARIGIDIRKIDDFGIGTYIRNLLRCLGRATKHDFTLLHKPGGAPDGLPGSMRAVEQRNRLYSLREPFGLGRSARRAGLELLHCPHYVTPFRPRCPIAVTIHDLIHLLFPEYLPSRSAHLYARFFLKRAARRAAVIFAVSENTRNDILNRLPAAEERVMVTYDAVDPRMAEPAGAELVEDMRFRLQLREPYVLYVGNSKRHKNLRAAVEAFALFRQEAGPDWRMVFIGNQRTSNDLMRRIETLGIRGAVRFFGFLGIERLRAAYAGAEAFLFPSLYEGFGLPPLEAMAAGTPVVASDRSAMPEVLGDAALLVDPENPEALADGLGRVIGDEQLREELIRKGLARARKFSWEETARLTLQGYDRALEAQ